MSEKLVGLLSALETDEPLYDKMPLEEAFVNMLNSIGSVDMKLLSNQTGLSPNEIAGRLKGAILQNPEPFDRGDASYDPYAYWTVRADYLSGNRPQKLKTAKRVNKKFGGIFERNILALKSVMPENVPIDDIHITLGAPWIPTCEYEQFAAEFLHLKSRVVIYRDDTLCTYTLTPPEEAKHSVRNCITYGVRGEHSLRPDNQYLTALNIILDSLNAKTIKVYDYRWAGWGRDGKYLYDKSFNAEKTYEAGQKQAAIENAFHDWVYSSPARIRRFEEYYNDKVVGYSAFDYDGAFLTLPGLNPNVTLYKRQRDVIARILLSPFNTLIADPVGAGKTYEMLVGAHERVRLGLSSKVIMTVPNNILKATEDAYRFLYPDDKNFIAVYPKDFTPKKRNDVLADIKQRSGIIVLMAYSSFDMINMSKAYYENKMLTELANLKRSANAAQLPHVKAALEAKAKKLSENLEKFTENTKETPYLPFDGLNIDTLIVDEAHNYKNIGVSSRSDNIVGLNAAGSKKCREMYEKVRSVRRTVFASGTPICNSLADLFVMQSYLQPEILKLNKISSFDMWINTFGKRESCPECDIDCNADSFRIVTRFSSFHNLTELMGMFSLICGRSEENTDDGLPLFSGPTDICIPKSKKVREYIDNLSERTDLIRAGLVKPHEDNLLSVISDGRAAAMHIRLIDEAITPDGITKTDACAEKIMEIYKMHPDSAQIVFSDIGIPRDGFNIYDDLKSKLVRFGLNEKEIAFIHDADSESARAKLFADMNKGLLKVVIGSTPKIGVGVNIQEKLVALHHLSVPWRPADMVQREGRILRKGNTSKQVYIFRYITEGTFDAYSWQLLENKQKFISSFLSGISGRRDSDDVADAVLSYAEVKALAIGNPLIKKRVETSNALERARISFRARQKQLIELKAAADSLPQRIKHHREIADAAYKDYAFYLKSKSSIPANERISFGEELLAALKDNICRDAERIFDSYQGFSVILPANMQKESPFVIIKGDNGRYIADMPLDKTPLGCSKTVDSLLERLSAHGDKNICLAEDCEKQLADAKNDMSKGNPYLSATETLKAELDKIDNKLNEAVKEDKAS